MRKLILINIILLVSIQLNAQYKDYKDPETCPFKLEEQTPIANTEDFNHPQISPDGTKVLVTKKGYKGIYIINLEKGETVEEISRDPKVGFRMKWLENGLINYTKNVKQSNKSFKKQYLTYDLNSKSTNSSYISESKRSSESLEIINNMRERIVQATNGEKTWTIVGEPGVYYELLLSPDSSKVLVHKNDGRMYVYAVDGSGLISCIGHGICKSWSPDGNYVLYFLSEDDGYRTIASELYIGSVDGKNNWKITNTNDKIEKWPHWSSKNNTIVYKDIESGLIYKSKIVKK